MAVSDVSVSRMKWSISFWHLPAQGELQEQPSSAQLQPDTPVSIQNFDRLYAAVKWGGYLGITLYKTPIIATEAQKTVQSSCSSELAIV